MTVGILSFIIREDCSGRFEKAWVLPQVLASSSLQCYSFCSLTRQEYFIIHCSAFLKHYTITVMPKHCLHTVPDHGCLQICLASVEFEDYFGGKYDFAHTFQSVLFFFFLFFISFSVLPFSSSALLCRARKILLVPSYFINCDRGYLGRHCITPGNFISVEMNVGQWPWHCKLVF